MSNIDAILVRDLCTDAWSRVETEAKMPDESEELQISRLHPSTYAATRNTKSYLYLQYMRISLLHRTQLL